MRLSEICVGIDMSSSEEVKLPYSEERVIKIKSIIKDFRHINFQESQKHIARYILIDLKALKSICKKQEVSLNSFKTTIQHTNALIYTHFRECSFNDSDVKYLQLAPRFIQFLRNTKSFAAFKHVSGCETLHNMCIEENPLIFECFQQIALMHLYMGSFSEMQSAQGWVKLLNQEGISLLQDRITQLQHKTYTSMVAERELIAVNVMPNLNQLFSVFENFVKENSSKEAQPSKDIQTCLYRKIAQDELLQSEEEKIVGYQQLLHTIKSISSILSTYNREAFSSIMKLTLCTDEQLDVLRKS